MKKLFYILTLLIPILINAQQPWLKSSPSDYMWMNVGNAGFSGGTAVYTSIKFSPDSQAYVAYADWGYGKNVSVMKYNGTDWVNVGNAGFSLMGADWISLAFSPVDGQPYVAFSDQMNYTKKASVMKFDGTNWIYVGTPSFSGSVAEYLSLAFSPSGEPYVAFCDAQVIKVSVMKFDGTNWVYIGNEGISEGMAQYSSLAFSPSGIPYVAFTEYLNNWKATVMKFNGANWEIVGNAGFSAGSADYSNLAFSPSGQPYVAYSDGGNSDKVTVMTFDGTNWVNVGNAGFSIGWAFSTSLAFNPSDGQPYVAFGDAGNSAKASLMKFDGTDWVYVGSAGFSAGMTTYTNLTFSPSGVPYIVYSDNANLLKTTVMKYDDTGVGINELQASGLLLYPNPASDNITIETFSTPVKSQLSVLDVGGRQIITCQFTEPKMKIDISTLPSGIYFVRLTDDRSVAVGKIVKQ
jgi:Secretion system C-terminal sorting domain